MVNATSVTSILQNKRITSNMKRTILLYAIQFMYLRIKLFWREDKDLYTLAILGVIISLIPVPTKLQHILSALLSFYFVFYPDSLLFYILYGFVQANTTYSVAILCMSLYPQCSLLLGQLEQVCLLFSCLAKLKFELINLMLSIILLFIALLIDEPPLEVFNIYQRDLKPTFLAIRSMIGEGDFALIAQEHKRVLGCTDERQPIQLSYLFCLVDWTTPLLLNDIPIMVKTFCFLAALIEIKRFHIVGVIFYFLLCLRLWYFAVFCFPFVSVTSVSAPDKMLNAFHVIIRILTGYALFKLYDAIVI